MPFSAHARARARRFAMQALYQWDLSGTDVPEIRRQFYQQEEFASADSDYFTELLTTIPAQIDSIDAALAEFIDRPFEQLDPVERAILRIGIHELLSRPEIPYRVVINEAVQLARKFGAEQGHAFVNGVLDRAAQVHRSVEYGKGGSQAAR